MAGGPADRSQSTPRGNGSQFGVVMKRLPSLILVACVMAGCVAGSTVSHEDDPAGVQRDAGPVLCRDGNPPPCTPRD